MRALKRPVALELFSGSGHLSKSWRKNRRTKHIPIFEWDIAWGEEMDLTKKSNQRILRTWMQQGFICMLWLGTPCNSWSRARDRPGGPPPLRSNAELFGLPNLRPCDQLKVHVGNTLLKASTSLLLLCLRLRIPAALENPNTSRLWLTPQINHVLRHHGTKVFTVDYCQYDMPWRKRTKVLGVLLDLSSASALCSGRGICSASNRPHVQLVGTHNGKFRTLEAEPYPHKLCRLWCNCFANAFLELPHKVLMAHV